MSNGLIVRYNSLKKDKKHKCVELVLVLNRTLKKKSREIIYFGTYLCVGWCACSFGYLVDKMHLWDISIYTDKGEELGLRARVLS